MGICKPSSCKTEILDLQNTSFGNQLAGSCERCSCVISLKIQYPFSSIEPVLWLPMLVEISSSGCISWIKNDWHQFPAAWWFVLHVKNLRSDNPSVDYCFDANKNLRGNVRSQYIISLNHCCGSFIAKPRQRFVWKWWNILQMPFFNRSEQGQWRVINWIFGVIRFHSGLFDLSNIIPRWPPSIYLSIYLYIYRCIDR